MMLGFSHAGNSVVEISVLFYLIISGKTDPVFKPTY